MRHTAKLPGRRPGAGAKKQPAGAMDAAHRKTARQEAGRERKKQPAGATDGPAGVKIVAGTGFERTRFSSGKTWNHQEPQRRLQRTSSRPRVVGRRLGSTAGTRQGGHPGHGEGLWRLIAYRPIVLMRGHPASIQVITSARRHRTTAPILIGAGALPDLAYRHNVLLPIANSAASCSTVRSSAWGAIGVGAMSWFPRKCEYRCLAAFMPDICCSATSGAGNGSSRPRVCRKANGTEVHK